MRLQDTSLWLCVALPLWRLLEPEIQPVAAPEEGVAAAAASVAHQGAVAQKGSNTVSQLKCILMEVKSAQKWRNRPFGEL